MCLAMDAHLIKYQSSSRQTPARNWLPMTRTGILSDAHPSPDTFISDPPLECPPAVISADSVDLADGGHSNGGSDINVSGDGCASDKIPVLVIGSQFLAGVCLDDINPLGNLHLAGLLEVGGQGHGEVLLVHVLDTHGRHLSSLVEVNQAILAWSFF